MPGGYPFIVKRGKFALHLPSGITAAEAIAHNKTGERLDGLDLGTGVKFLGKAQRSLARVGFEYAEGFDLAEWPSACEKLIALRDPFFTRWRLNSPARALTADANLDVKGIALIPDLEGAVTSNQLRFEISG
jgi:hypothetical protein